MYGGGLLCPVPILCGVRGSGFMVWSLEVFCMSWSPPPAPPVQPPCPQMGKEGLIKGSPGRVSALFGAEGVSVGVVILNSMSMCRIFIAD